VCFADDVPARSVASIGCSNTMRIRMTVLELLMRSITITTRINNAK
jgi:hypothetical protein